MDMDPELLESKARPGVGARAYSASGGSRNAGPAATLATLDVSGVEIPWCAAAGPGAPVVLFGGLGWRASGAVRSGTIGGGVPLVALDYPRRWPRRPLDSMQDLARLYGAALEALGVRDARLLGFSVGGMVALSLALERPELVASVALVSTAAAGERVAGRWRLPLARAVAGALPSEAFHRFYRTWGPRLVGTELCGSPSEAARVWSDPMGRRKMGDLLRAVARFDARDRLDQLRRPTLIVHGERDFVFEPAAALELARGIPTARAVLIEGADHFAFVTHRKRVMRDLDQFWRSDRP